MLNGDVYIGTTLRRCCTYFLLDKIQMKFVNEKCEYTIQGVNREWQFHLKNVGHRQLTMWTKFRSYPCHVKFHPFRLAYISSTISKIENKYWNAKILPEKHQDKTQTLKLNYSHAKATTAFVKYYQCH